MQNNLDLNCCTMMVKVNADQSGPLLYHGESGPLFYIMVKVNAIQSGPFVVPW